MDGIINVYKEAGFTSFDVVAKLRGILGQKKIGHTGTLDPDAEGVLPVCVGKATKVCEYLTEQDKVYQATLRLGVVTDTQDASGAVLMERKPDITEERLCEIIKSFSGRIRQIPPMYSALKVNGKKLCDLARQGITVERKAREIEIYSIKILSIEMPRVELFVHCSKGTYIRTLCHDIGEAAGCGGCMERLLRVKTAGFSVDGAYRLREIEEIVKRQGQGGPKISELFIPVDEALKEYPKAVAKKGMEKLLRNGCAVPEAKLLLTPEGEADLCRMYDASGTFIGLFRHERGKRAYRPKKMFL